MKKILMLTSLMLPFIAAQSQFADTAQYPVYTGRDLGLTYSVQQSAFRIWAPTAWSATVTLYNEGRGGQALQKIPMKKGKDGTWFAVARGNWENKYYTFSIQVNDNSYTDLVDPYARAVGVNGKRAMIVDLRKTNPTGWTLDKSPALRQPTDAVIYELHVRDASIDSNSGIKAKGKFLGLTEWNTHNLEGLATGLSHIKQLGVTHVHLLPCFDFNSVDESQPLRAQYNWGYDPLNYNAPEGSYSTNAYDGRVRIREFKQLIQAFHQRGIGVIMDVVFNHTALSTTSDFNQLVPGYYYRENENGSFSDATGCGNEVASERAMVRKFILESVRYWVEEYHVDGFRFDLMGVHDLVTMNLLSKELHRIKPGIILYGEGWTAGQSPLPDSLRALKANVAQLHGVAVFSDDIRDGIKGSVFHEKDRGFASGNISLGAMESVKFGIVAACPHPQIDYTKVNYSKRPYASAPAQVITYAECHDNNTLWDKLSLSAKDASESERREMQKLALSIVLTSQGIPLLHAGTEFLRSKKGVENSYHSPDSINQIDWELKTKNKDVFDYIAYLIQLRKAHPAFRQVTAQGIANTLHFRQDLPAGIIAYTIDGKKAGDGWQKIQVLFNGSGARQAIKLDGQWNTAIRQNTPAKGEKVNGNMMLSPYSCTVLYQ